MREYEFTSTQQFDDDFPHLKDGYKLVVEGTDDIDAFELFIEKLNNRALTNWVVVSAGSKDKVLKGIKNQSKLIGIVDRDDWTDSEIAQKQNEYENLFVLPRFCIENYCIVPSEVHAVFADKIALPQLESEVEQHKDRWLRHGALWHVFNPMWRGIRAQGFVNELTSHNAILDDEQIKRKLEQWQTYLNADEMFTRYQQFLFTSRDLPLEEVLLNRVHGKHFFKQLITPIFNRHVAHLKADRLQTEILKRIASPTDLQPLWDKMQQMMDSD